MSLDLGLDGALSESRSLQVRTGAQAQPRGEGESNLSHEQRAAHMKSCMQRLRDLPNSQGKFSGISITHARVVAPTPGLRHRVM